jgi:lipopolysaccharide assembly protein B
VYPKTATPDKFARVCRSIIAANPQDWRARLALSRHLSAAGDHAAAIDLLFEALINNPHGLSIHQEIWKTLTGLDLAANLVNRYVELAHDAVFYTDPHICIRCRYRSTELLWQCPQCHEWNSFVEERIAPAKEENV